MADHETSAILTIYNICCSLILLIILGAFGIYEGLNLGEVLDHPTTHLNQVAKDWDIVPFVEIQVTDDASC